MTDCTLTYCKNHKSHTHELRGLQKWPEPQLLLTTVTVMKSVVTSVV